MIHDYEVYRISATFRKTVRAEQRRFSTSHIAAHVYHFQEQSQYEGSLAHSTCPFPFRRSGSFSDDTCRGTPDRSSTASKSQRNDLTQECIIENKDLTWSLGVWMCGCTGPFASLARMSLAFSEEWFMASGVDRYCKWEGTCAARLVRLKGSGRGWCVGRTVEGRRGPRLPPRSTVSESHQEGSSQIHSG